MFFVIINLIILFGCDDVIIYLKKLCIYGCFFLEIRLKIDNYLFNYFYYNRYRNYGNWEL